MGETVEIRLVVEFLVQDAKVLETKSRIADWLRTPPDVVDQLDRGYKTGTLTPYEYIKGILESWVRRQGDVTVTDLQKLLKEMQLVSASEALGETFGSAVITIPQASVSVGNKAGAQRSLTLINMKKPPQGFVGRKEELSKVKDFLTGWGQTLVISGPPGIGKTSLLLHFFDQAQKVDFGLPFLAVTWLHGNNLIALTESVISCATFLGIPWFTTETQQYDTQLNGKWVKQYIPQGDGNVTEKSHYEDGPVVQRSRKVTKNDELDTILSKIRNCFSTEGKDWVVVLDGVEEEFPSILDTITLLCNLNAKVVLTSSGKQGILLQPSSSITLEGLKKTEVSSLVQQYISAVLAEEAADFITPAEGHPLGLKLAAGFIYSQDKAPMDVKELLGKTEALKKLVPEYRDHGPILGIVLTSLAYIEGWEKGKLLLQTIAHLSPEGVSIESLKTFLKLNETIHEVIQTLLPAQSLALIHISDGMVAMHPFVMSIIRKVVTQPSSSFSSFFNIYKCEKALEVKLQATKREREGLIQLFWAWKNTDESFLEEKFKTGNLCSEYDDLIEIIRRNYQVSVTRSIIFPALENLRNIRKGLRDEANAIINKLHDEENTKISLTMKTRKIIVTIAMFVIAGVAVGVYYFTRKA